MMIFTKKKNRYDEDDDVVSEYENHHDKKKKNGSGKKNKDKNGKSSSGGGGGGFSLFPFSMSKNDNVKDKKNKKNKTKSSVTGKLKKKQRQSDDDDYEQQPEVRLSAPMTEKRNRKVEAMKRFHRFSMATIGPGKMFNTQSDKHRKSINDDDDDTRNGGQNESDDFDMQIGNDDYNNNDDHSWCNNQSDDQDTRSTGGSMLSAAERQRQQNPDQNTKWKSKNTATGSTTPDSLIGHVIVNRRASNQTTKMSNRSKHYSNEATTTNEKSPIHHQQSNKYGNTNDRPLSHEASSTDGSFACDSGIRFIHSNKSNNNKGCSTSGSVSSPKDRSPQILNSTMTNNAKLKAKAKALKKRVAIVHDSWFRFICQSKYFCTLSDNVFDIVDYECTGVVDESELYQGLLLIHLKLGVFLGPAACRPISRQQCHNVFLKMDRENTGVLDKIEFREVIILFFGNILSRVILQWCITILVVPLIASNFSKCFVGTLSLLFGCITMFGSKSASSTGLGGLMATVSQQQGQQQSMSYLQRIGYGLNNFIPEKVRKRTPLVLSSTLLGTVVIPVLIYQVDSFFQKVADSRSKKQPVKHKY